MSSAVGWTLIAIVFLLPSLVLLWPGYRYARRRNPRRRALGWLYLGASAGCALCLWFLVPVVVHAVFGAR
jgi:hypothetical protein